MHGSIFDCLSSDASKRLSSHTSTGCSAISLEFHKRKIDWHEGNIHHFWHTHTQKAKMIFRERITQFLFDRQLGFCSGREIAFFFTLPRLFCERWKWFFFLSFSNYLKLSPLLLMQWNDFINILLEKKLYTKKHTHTQSIVKKFSLEFYTCNKFEKRAHFEWVTSEYLAKRKILCGGSYQADMQTLCNKFERKKNVSILLDAGLLNYTYLRIEKCLYFFFAADWQENLKALIVWIFCCIRTYYNR